MDWERVFASRTSRMKASEIRELLKLLDQPDILSFAGGIPDPALFPADAFQAAFAEIFASNQRDAALQYSVSEGNADLRDWIAGEMWPTYLGALGAFNAYEPVFDQLTPTGNRAAADYAATAAAQGGRVKAAYMSVDFANPTGVIAKIAKSGFDAQVAKIKAVYRARRDHMLTALARDMPSGVSWSKPEGGMFVWMTLPGHIDGAALLAESLQTEKVAFVPGRAFFADGMGGNTLRLSFTQANEAQIDEGMRRLGRVIAQSL